MSWLRDYWRRCNPHEHKYKEVWATPNFESSILTGMPIQVGWTRRWQCKCGATRVEGEIRGTGASAQQDAVKAQLKSGIPIICMGYRISWDHETDKPVYEKLPEGG